MNAYIALLSGAVIGSSLRYLISIYSLSINGLPISTALVNILGSSLAGFFLYKFNNTAYIFLYIGLFGSFTTLSSFNIELFNLINEKLFMNAFLFFFLNIFLSFLFFYLSYLLSLKIAN